jgi:hypothetical protein
LGTTAYKAHCHFCLRLGKKESQHLKIKKKEKKAHPQKIAGAKRCLVSFDYKRKKI